MKIKTFLVLCFQRISPLLTIPIIMLSFTKNLLKPAFFKYIMFRLHATVVLEEDEEWKGGRPGRHTIGGLEMSRIVYTGVPYENVQQNY